MSVGSERMHDTPDVRSFQDDAGRVSVGLRLRVQSVNCRCVINLGQADVTFDPRAGPPEAPMRDHMGKCVVRRAAHGPGGRCMGASIVRGQSCAADARQAVAELHAAIAQPDMALVVFFCSPDFDLDVIAGAIREHLRGDTGRRLHHRGRDRAGRLPGAESGRSQLLGRRLHGNGRRHRSAARVRGRPGRVVGPGSDARLERTAEVTPEESFALLLVDGASVREEPLTHALQQQLGRDSAHRWIRRRRSSLRSDVRVLRRRVPPGRSGARTRPHVAPLRDRQDPALRAHGRSRRGDGRGRRATGSSTRSTASRRPRSTPGSSGRTSTG